MELFCAAFRRDSVSILKFSFRSHVSLFACEISLVYRLEYLYNCFSLSLLLFFLLTFMLPVLILVAVISLPLPFFLFVVFNALTLSLILASLLPLPFLDIYK